MKYLMIVVSLVISTQASANCTEFLDQIKPYQIAYSRATTILQQQVALTAIQVIQNQYLNDACRFRLDTYDELARKERMEAARIKQEEENAIAERIAIEEKKNRKIEAKRATYDKCIRDALGTDLTVHTPDEQKAVDQCNAAYNGK